MPAVTCMLQHGPVLAQGTDPTGLGKEAVLAWIAAAAGVNAVRTSGGESKGVIDRKPLKKGSSDGFGLGLVALCLTFCKPFLGGEQKHLDRLDAGYYAQHAYRWALLPFSADVALHACLHCVACTQHTYQTSVCLWPATSVGCTSASVPTAWSDVPYQ